MEEEKRIGTVEIKGDSSPASTLIVDLHRINLTTETLDIIEMTRDEVTGKLRETKRTEIPLKDLLA